jgi:hypothetical protein
MSWWCKEVNVVRVNDDALALKLIENLLGLRSTRHVMAAAVGHELTTS